MVVPWAGNAELVGSSPSSPFHFVISEVSAYCLHCRKATHNQKSMWCRGMTLAGQQQSPGFEPHSILSICTAFVHCGV